MALQEIIQDALALSDEDREKLLAALHDSLEPDDGEILAPQDWEAAWADEIDKRLKDLTEGRAKTHSHEAVIADLRSRLARR